jgi:hypothetical protein
MDESAWKIANPAIGRFRSAEDVREQAERALRMPSAEPTFRNLVLNQRVEIVSPFVASGVWMLNSGEVDDAAEPEYRIQQNLQQYHRGNDRQGGEQQSPLQHHELPLC